jgi:hypothetical protein
MADRAGHAPNLLLTPCSQDLKRIKKQKMKDIIKAMEAFNENLVGGKRLVKVLLPPFSRPLMPSFQSLLGRGGIAMQSCRALRWYSNACMSCTPCT